MPCGKGRPGPTRARRAATVLDTCYPSKDLLCICALPTGSETWSALAMCQARTTPRVWALAGGLMMTNTIATCTASGTVCSA